MKKKRKRKNGSKKLHCLNDFNNTNTYFRSKKKTVWITLQKIELVILCTDIV